MAAAQAPQSKEREARAREGSCPQAPDGVECPCYPKDVNQNRSERIMLRLNGVRLLALCLPLAATPAAFAQIKIAVVDTQAALSETAEIKKAQADLEAKFKPRQEQFQKLQKELQAIQQQLETLGNKLTPQAQNEMNLQAQRKQRELQRFSEDLQADVDRERNEILSRASQRLKAVIDKLAEEKGLDLVFDLNDTVYHKAALDITKEATAAYDKAYPVK